MICDSSTAAFVKKAKQIREAATKGKNLTFDFSLLLSEEDTNAHNLVDQFLKLNLQTREKFLTLIFLKLNKNEICLLATLLGKSQREIIRKECKEVSCVYKSVQELMDFNLKTWIQERNDIFMAFICGLLNIDKLEALKESNYLYLAIVYENIYRIYMKQISVSSANILPVSFMASLYCYMLTSSKTSIDALSAIIPSGSYRSIRNWLTNLASKPVSYPEKGSLFNVFDNSQVIGRKHGLKPGNKVNTSIMTMKGYLQCNQSVLQESKEISPQEQSPYMSLLEYEDKVRELKESKSLNRETQKAVEQKQKFQNAITKI